MSPDPTPFPSTRFLPRGSAARDRNGDTLITWPDGSYGYDTEHKHPGTSPSHSSGPYVVALSGLDVSTCDALAAGRIRLVERDGAWDLVGAF